ACSIDDRYVSSAAAASGSAGTATNAAAVAPNGSPAPNVASDTNDVAASERTENTPSVSALSSSAGMPDASSVATPAEQVDASLHPIAVAGHIIDCYRRPVPGVVVRVGAASATTDDTGAFAIGTVTPPYDAAVQIDTTKSGVPAHAEYVYQGLERSDPTLQVYDALPEHSATINVALTNVNFAANNVLVAFDAPGAHFSALLQSSQGTLDAISWTGSATLQGTAHAIELPTTPTFSMLADQVSIVQRQDVALSLSDGDSPTLSFVLGVASGSTAEFAGTVNGGTLGNRENLLLLRLSDGTPIPMLEAPSTTPFLYYASLLSGTTLLVAAAQGAAAPSARAIVHHDNMASGQAGIQLTLPDPVVLTGPASAAAAESSTPFAWSAAGQSARSFVWHLQLSASSNELFVVTNRTQIALADLPPGFTWAAGSAAQWSVQTHGDTASVDDLAGPNGFMDAFSYPSPSIPTSPSGPNHADGYFTESELRAVTLH
ncbi:MAG TPA: hypothetical protein VG963_25985, partial [Polyangiaceae bacterium]|nr:hypothetical protein [Polyangiaceae bacterium]